MERGLRLTGDRARVGRSELADQIRREDVALADGQELIVGDVEGRPKTQAGIGGPGSEIGLIPHEQRVFVGDVPIDAGDAEILGRILRAHKVVYADIGVARHEPVAEAGTAPAWQPPLD